MTDEVVFENPDPVFQFSATLRNFGDIPDLDEISTHLGLRPTNSHKRGDRKGPRSPVYKHDHWSYQAPVPEDLPLDVHIETLWAHLKPNKDYLLELKRRCRVDVFCGYRSDHPFAGFQITPGALEIFRVLDVPFGLSVIVL